MINNNKKALIIFYGKIALKYFYKKRTNKKFRYHCNKYFILFLNILLFFINIYFLTIYINISINFRNVDKIPLVISSKPYNNISNYIISKFHLNRISNYTFNKEKIILIDCVDFLSDNKYCVDKLNEMFKNKNYIFKLDTNNPDYILYDIFGCEHNKSKYKNSVKISFYTENILPDFSEADYALSQAHFSYLDRYFKYPSLIRKLYKLDKNIITKRRKEVLNNLNRTKFCAAVITNNYSLVSFRLNFIKQLNKYKIVDMGGSAFNNVGGKVLNKIDFLSSYKFSIAMENSEGDGYASEKIIESFLAGTIPIYYGDYMIDEYINPKSYILIKNEKNIKKKLNI